ncbi:uncharacterized protein [Rutidosis leptorrhynchoides]|uniref:uncharacterized protein n=1 Tax=Rutidosis leptorrhynchoides TaxID=125765 RepID=UPI003A99F713
MAWDALWVKVIKSLYGSHGGLGCINSLDPNDQKRFAGRTWFSITNLEHTLTKLGCDNSNLFVKVIGPGTDTSFWEDKWCGNTPFKLKYPRLYRLERQKSSYVAYRINWAENSPSFSWNWASEPKWRASGELENLLVDLAAFPHPSADSDRWNWNLHTNGSFSTKSLSDLLTDLSIANIPCHDATILNPLIPQKVGIFIWRAKQNKIPVRFELDNKGIDLHSTRCPICDDAIETAQHALLDCKVAVDIWERVRKWWNVDNLHISHIRDISKASTPAMKTKTGSQIWQATIWVTCYFIWKNRNDRVFESTSHCIPKIFADI